MDFFRGGTLLLATVLTGLIAGLFYAWSVSVMPGLAKTDDRTYLGALQGMNRAILNGWFFLSFMGALIVTAVAALLHLRTESRGVLLWIVIGLVLYIAVLAITFRVNVPLNNELDAANLDQLANPADLRARFESTWVRWNVIRALLNTAAFGSLCYALVRS
jgi:uncharacterized membrane protein